MRDFPKKIIAKTNSSGEKLTPISFLVSHATVLQLALLVFVLDQFTKYVVRESLPYRYSFPDQGFLRFTHTHNTGSAFGILQGQNFPLIFVAIMGIMVLLIIYFTQPKPNKWLSVSIGLQIGGAIGNLCDRLHQGWVTDFLDVGPWPVFNIADSSIVVGLILLCWLFMRASPNVSEEKIPPAQHDGDNFKSTGQCTLCDADMIVTVDGSICNECRSQSRC